MPYIYNVLFIGISPISETIQILSGCLRNQTLYVGKAATTICNFLIIK
jgi:hypothetical protein